MPTIANRLVSGSAAALALLLAAAPATAEAPDATDRLGACLVSGSAGAPRDSLLAAVVAVRSLCHTQISRVREERRARPDRTRRSLEVTDRLPGGVLVVVAEGAEPRHEDAQSFFRRSLALGPPLAPDHGEPERHGEEQASHLKPGNQAEPAHLGGAPGEPERDPALGGEAEGLADRRHADAVHAPHALEVDDREVAIPLRFNERTVIDAVDIVTGSASGSVVSGTLALWRTDASGVRRASKAGRAKR